MITKEQVVEKIEIAVQQFKQENPDIEVKGTVTGIVSEIENFEQQVEKMKERGIVFVHLTQEEIRAIHYGAKFEIQAPKVEDFVFQMQKSYRTPIDPTDVEREQRHKQQKMQQNYFNRHAGKTLKRKK